MLLELFNKARHQEEPQKQYELQDNRELLKSLLKYEIVGIIRAWIFSTPIRAYCKTFPPD